MPAAVRQLEIDEQQIIVAGKQRCCSSQRTRLAGQLPVIQRAYGLNNRSSGVEIVFDDNESYGRLPG